MIRAKHHPLIYGFFRKYASCMIKRKFHDVIITGKTDATQNPVLLISNHISWWDGFWALYLNMKVFDKKFHFMMDEAGLSERWLFNYSGGFSVNNNNRSMLTTLQYCNELLQDSNNLVLIYPQGKIHSAHDDNFSFKKGINRIQTDQIRNLKIIMLIQLTDYFEHPRPTLFLYLKEVDCSPELSIESQYSNFYQETIHKHIQKVI